METNRKKLININISTLTIVKIILIFLLLYFVFLIREILIVLFISLIFASAIDPWIDWMKKKKIPRGVGVLLIYLVLFAVIGSTVYLIIPPIAQQMSELSTNFPYYFEKIISGFSVLKEYSVQHGILDNIKDSLGTINSNLQQAAGGIFSTISGIFGGIFSFLLVLVITFYMVVEESAIKKLVWSIAPSRYQPYIMQLINRMQKKIGLWLRGQLILSLVIFILTYVGLLILGVEYALVLALIAGLTEFVPYLGPIFGAIPAIFLAFTQSPMLALFVVILFFIVQQVENNILVPKIMQKTVGLNPIISISALMIGFKLAGVVGAIMSIPVATAISVFIKDMFDGRGAETENNR
ncbi:MAG: AI-2E family transporter [Patescibacteria group bacterium]|nr:AI-2E family transporter [Patescibacteria group bacterium]